VITIIEVAERQLRAGSQADAFESVEANVCEEGGGGEGGAL